jgi:hypothetical protein
MTDWYIDTNKGDFMASSLEEVIKQTIEFYGTREDSVDTITNIYAVIDGEIFQQLPSSEVYQIQQQIEDAVIEWIRIEREEQKGFNAIRSDYFANLI